MSGDPATAGEGALHDFRQDALRGLAASPKVLSGKYLWDERGSRMFEEITRSPAYYPTTTETALLAAYAGEIAPLVGPGATVVEFGSGATDKVALLLGALEAPRRFVGLDISSAFSDAASARLRGLFPSLDVAFVEADFSRELPPLPLKSGSPVVGFLLGCAIGNLEPAEATSMLARVRRALAGGLLLVGQDANHDVQRLQAAYGGPIMAAFHKNILTRLRFELGAKLLPERFRHEARLVGSPRRMEAHLVAVEPTEIELDGQAFAFEAGESIRTDVSIKYAPDAFVALAEAAGWRALRRWTDPEDLFCLHLMRPR